MNLTRRAFLKATTALPVAMIVASALRQKDFWSGYEPLLDFDVLRSPDFDWSKTPDIMIADRQWWDIYVETLNERQILSLMGEGQMRISSVTLQGTVN